MRTRARTGPRSGRRTGPRSGRRTRRGAAPATVAVLVAVAGLAGSIGLAVPALAAAPTATFTRVADWGTGFEGRYTIANPGPDPVATWRLEFDLPAGSAVASFWDADLARSGDHYTFTAKSWNAAIPAGGSTGFGFTGTPGGVTPSGCRINGAPCDGSGGDTRPPSVPGGLRVTGVTSSSVALAWTAATDDVAVTGYDVLRDGAAVLTVTGTTATVAGLRSSTAYRFAVRARDAAGNTSALSAEVTATTSAGPPPPSGNWPFVAPYLDMGAWPTPVLSEVTQQGGLRGVTMAFVTGVGCRASWFNAFDPRTGWQREEVDRIRAAGGDVKISFGGAAGTELAQACTDVTALYNEYKAVTDAYGATYLDFDIEGAAVADPASVQRRSLALARLQQTYPGLRISLTLPVLPEGLTADGVAIVRSARDAGVRLDLVNVMAMDYYRTGLDYGDAAVRAAQSTFGQLKALFPALADAALWRMVGVTPMLGENDDHNVFDQADARQLVTFAAGRHLGMLSFWELTRDRNACFGALFKCTNLAQQPYEFSRIFAQYTG